MKDKITLKEFFDSNERLVIHCDTKQKATKLLIEFDKLGESYLTYNFFYINKDEACYSNIAMYSGIEFLKDENIKIYSFEDIIFEEAKPKNLIPEIAKMLGVEIGEEFIVVEHGYPKYKLDLEYGLMYLDDVLNIWIRTESTLNKLLLNLSTIKKPSQAPQLTEAERVILENLPKGYQWIVRDKDDELRMFNIKPYKIDVATFWGCAVGVSLSLEAFGYLFKFIRWDDQEPYNIKELLKGE